MKNYPLLKSIAISVFLFSFCVLEVSAQPPDNSMARDIQKNAMKQTLLASWNGDGALMAGELIQKDEFFREGIGVSKEQTQTISDAITNMQQNMQNDPEFNAIMQEMMKLRDEAYPKSLSPEAQTKFFELQTQMMNIPIRNVSKIVNENLSAEQMLKVKEFQISIMSEIPLVSPSMFEALDLAEDQKLQLEEIKKKLEPEFKKNVDDMADFHVDFMEKVQPEIGEKAKGVTDPKELQKIYSNAAKKVEEKHPEFRQRQTKLLESGKAFAKKLKFQMFDVLTDKQMERMGQLVDNPPEYVKKMLAQIRKEFGVDEKDNASEQWQPSLNSWKPGDPIPEEYLEQRKAKRFPSKK